MPYLYAKAIEAHIEGTPVMRPMVFEFTGDPAVNYLDTQYMLGEALLVSPDLPGGWRERILSAAGKMDPSAERRSA